MCANPQINEQNMYKVKIHKASKNRSTPQFKKKNNINKIK